MKRYRSYLFWLLAAFVVVGGVALIARPAPTPVETAIVERRLVETSVESEAKTRIHDRYVVASTVSGRLLRVRFDEGDRVRAGEPVASIDPLPADASVEAALEKLRALDAQLAGVETLRPKVESLAQADARVRQSAAAAASARERVASADVALRDAEREAKRQRGLESQGYASRLTLERAELALQLRTREARIARTDLAAASAQTAIDRAAALELRKKISDPDYLREVYRAQSNEIQAQLRTLEDERTRTTLRAPVSGKVLRVLQKSEAYVIAGAPIMEIGDRGTLEIVADVLSQDAVDIHPGDRVEVVSGAGNARVRGTVRRIEPSGYTKISALGVEEQRVNVLIDIAGSTPALGDGYRLDVRIVTSSARSLAVPIAALYRCGVDWCAFVVRDARAHAVRVKIGRMGADDAEVLSGLRAGDVVVLRPPESLDEGSRVEAQTR